jgi:hypothetical protein
MRNVSDDSFLKRKKIGKFDLDDFIWYILLFISIIGLTLLLVLGVNLLLIPDAQLAVIFGILIITSLYCIQDKYETEVKTLAILSFAVMLGYHYGNTNFISQLRNKVNNETLTYTFNPTIANVNNVDSNKIVDKNISTKDSWIQAATNEGLKPLRDLDSTELLWCKKDDDNDSVLNSNEYYQAALHCSTGKSWSVKSGWSDKKL